MAVGRGGEEEWAEWGGRGGREQCFPIAARALIALTFGCKTIDHDDAHCLFDREGDTESGRERGRDEEKRERGGKCNANVECECEC